MEEEKECRFKGDTVVLDTYADTAIIVSEFFETDRWCEVRIIGHVSTEEFLPFLPASYVVGHVADERPEDECPEEEHEKYFHADSVSYFSPLQSSKQGGIIPRKKTRQNGLEWLWDFIYCVCPKIMKKLLLSSIIFSLLIGSVSALTLLNYAEYLADKHVIVRQRPIENYALGDKVLRQEVVGIALRLTAGNFRTIEPIQLPDVYTCENIFLDVGQNKPNSWGCRSVEIAAKNKIITTNNKHFRPEQDITRAEAIAMILSGVKLMPKTDTSRPWQEVVMENSEKLGILPEGVTNGDEKITRWELFYVVSNIIKVLYKQEIIYIDSLAE